MTREKTRVKVVADWKSALAEVAVAMRGAFTRASANPDILFYRMIHNSARGDTAALAEYLRSDKPLSKSYRNKLAELVEGKIKSGKKPKRGRPKNEIEYEAAWVADKFYREWRAENKRVGINDRGHADAMKDEAIKTVCEISAGLCKAKQSVVRDLMDRGRY